MEFSCFCVLKPRGGRRHSEDDTGLVDAQAIPERVDQVLHLVCGSPGLLGASKQVDVQRRCGLIREETDEVRCLEAGDVAGAKVVDDSWQLVGCEAVGKGKLHIYSLLTVLLT